MCVWTWYVSGASTQSVSSYLFLVRKLIVPAVLVPFSAANLSVSDTRDCTVSLRWTRHFGFHIYWSGWNSRSSVETAIHFCLFSVRTLCQIKSIILAIMFISFVSRSLFISLLSHLFCAIFLVDSLKIILNFLSTVFFDMYFLCAL